MPLNWLEEVREVSGVGLTVQAQALSIDQVDPNQQLVHPALAPYVDSPSVELATIVETDFRPISSRREWNGPGRLIPDVLPRVDRLEMTPIEDYFVIGEREMQKLQERALGNEQLIRDQIQVSIPQRVDKLVEANYRLVEKEFLEAWAKGQITAYNPTTKEAAVFSLGFAAGRVQTAGTAWSAVTDAYTEFLDWIQDGETVMGQIVGAMMSRSVFNAIQADAPNPIQFGGTGITATRRTIEQLIQDQLDHPFRITVNETTADDPTDGGTAYTRVRMFPAGYVVAIPQGGIVGNTHQAPQTDAMDIARRVPEAKVNIRGMAVRYLFENHGKTARVQCQCNWLPLPQERNMWSINTLTV